MAELISLARRAYEVFYEKRLLAMKEASTKFAYGHVTSRECPGMESIQYFDMYKLERMVEEQVDLSGTLVNDFGPWAKDLNPRLKLRGPTRVVDAATAAAKYQASAGGSQNAVHIFTNSVRQLAVMHGENEVYTTQDGSETGLTMAAPNYYEWFPENEWNKNVFVYIVTTESAYQDYIRFFPHFLYVIQPNPQDMGLISGSVGLTRLAALSYAKQAGLEVAFFLDDTIFDLSLPTRKLNAADSVGLFSELTKVTQGTNDDRPVGYVGMCTGSFLGDAEWEQKAKSLAFFKDREVTGPQQRLVAKVRYFSSEPKAESLQTTSDFGTLSFVNQHRPNFIAVNVARLRDKNINYVPVHGIGEDMYFTGRVVAAGLCTAQANIRFIRPGDDRRPKTCSADGAGVIQNWLKSDDEMKRLLERDVDVILSDFYMYHGRLLFINERGVLGGAGVYGPVRVLPGQAQAKAMNADITASIITKGSNASRNTSKNAATCIKRYDGKAGTLNFTETSHLLYYPPPPPEGLSQSSRSERLSRPFCTRQPGAKQSSKQSQKECDQQYYRDFGLASYEESRILPSTGMYKYTKDYEFILAAIEHHMYVMYTGRTGASAPGTGKTFQMQYSHIRAKWQGLMDWYTRESRIVMCLADMQTLLHPLSEDRTKNELELLRKVRFFILRVLSTCLRLLRILQLLQSSERGQFDKAYTRQRIVAITFSFGNIAQLERELGGGITLTPIFPKSIFENEAEVLQAINTLLSKVSAFAMMNNMPEIQTPNNARTILSGGNVNKTSKQPKKASKPRTKTTTTKHFKTKTKPKPPTSAKKVKSSKS